MKENFLSIGYQTFQNVSFSWDSISFPEMKHFQNVSSKNFMNLPTIHTKLE